DQLAQILQVDVSGHELGEGIDHGDDGFLEVFILHAGGAPEGAGAGHVATGGGGAGTVLGHGNLNWPRAGKPARIPKSALRPKSAARGLSTPPSAPWDNACSTAAAETHSA